ncbi:ABC transporter permease [Clostridium gasigenes]|uniref:ABC-2 type transport system permease protein n=1 Tax=Clostridium gasigenes TaxID=94869 RepID=A0A1H0VUP6_9CLOT|nr:ABC transporter permease [Clostridium gasigenes]SDP82170.1 ABC-2 type transport system permease protein [Clostridium gasigenes]
MINYIKAELYRNFNRKYLWIATVIISILAILGNVALLKVKTDMDIETSNKALAMLFNMVLTMPIFIVVFFVDCVTAEENKFDTVKNVITFGLSRTKLVLGKIITSTLIAIIVAIVAISVFIISYATLIGLNDEMLVKFYDLLRNILVVMPLWIASICMATSISIVVKNSNVFIMIYLGIISLDGLVVKILATFVWSKLSILNDILIGYKIEEIIIGQAEPLSAIVLGVIYIVLFTTLSVVFINKKEIN